MSINNSLLAIAGVLIALLATLFIAPYLIDWNGYRGDFEREASRMLGREVRIGGDLNVRLLPRPYVRLEKVRVAGEPGAPDEPLFRADAFTLNLSVTPLLRGVIEAKEVIFKRPQFRLVFDREGRSNWQKLTFGNKSGVFVPAEIVFNSVKIEDGAFIVQARGQELTRLDSIEGELSADALNGPFKFQGTTSWNGVSREVRLTTALWDGVGGLRLKSTVRIPATNNRYVLDGHLEGLVDKPQFKGELTGLISLDKALFRPATEGQPLVPATVLPAPSSEEDASTKATALGVEFKSRIVAHGEGLSLEDMALSFENVGQPQILTGSAKTSWGEALSWDFSLESRWLDLDRFAGSDQGAAPITVARSFATVLMGLMPKEGKTSARFAVDQVNLGGESVSGLAIVMSRKGQTLDLERLQVGLPGGTRLDLSGNFDTTGTSGATPKFKGRLGVRGASLARFASWLSKGQTWGGFGVDGPFTLTGAIGADASIVELRDASADMGGTSFKTDIRYTTEGRPKLFVVLEGHTIDLTQIWPGVGPEHVWQPLAALASKDRHVMPIPGLELRLDVRVAALRMGDQELRAVETSVDITAERVTVSKLAFRAAGDLTLDLAGDVTMVKGYPKGALRWTADASNGAAVTAFLRTLNPHEEAGSLQRLFGALAPFRLAGSVTFGERGDGVADVAVDGSVRDGRAIARLRLDGGIEGWRDAPAEFVADIEGADLAPLLPALFGTEVTEVTGENGGSAVGRLSITAVKGSAPDFAAVARLETDGLVLAFDGLISPDTKAFVSGYNGMATVAIRDVRRCFALMGLAAGPALVSTAIEGRVRLAVSDAGVVLEPESLMVGGSRVTGRLTAARGEQAVKLAGDLAVSDSSVSALLAPLLGNDPSSTEDALTREGVWPRATFDFSLLKGWEGEIALRFERLAMMDGLAMTDAALRLAVTPGKVTVSQLQGRAMGGGLVSDFVLEKVPAGVRLSGDLSFSNVDLAQMASAGRPVKGQGKLNLTFAGLASSPAALIATLEGKGEIALAGLQLRGLSPDGLADAMDAFVLEKNRAQGGTLQDTVRKALDQGELKFNETRVAVTLQDGAARLASLAVETPAGRTVAETVVDLATFKIDSEWRIEARPFAKIATGTAAKPLLPAVTVVYVGPLPGMAALEPSLSIEALERELAVRSLERNVEELERLRKEDEALAREEAARRNVQEESLKTWEAEVQSEAPQPSTTPTPDGKDPDRDSQSTGPLSKEDAATVKRDGKLVVPPPKPVRPPRPKRNDADVAPPRRKPPPDQIPWQSL